MYNKMTMLLVILSIVYAIQANPIFEEDGGKLKDPNVLHAHAVCSRANIYMF